MVPQRQAGFTLIELMVVVLIVGILAAFALPKYAATTDTARLASVKNDVHNVQLAEEAYLGDHKVYGTLAQLEKADMFYLSSDNTMTIKTAASGFTVTATNQSITSKKMKKCTVQVGAGATIGVDGVLVCS